MVLGQVLVGAYPAKSTNEQRSLEKAPWSDASDSTGMPHISRGDTLEVAPLPFDRPFDRPFGLASRGTDALQGGTDVPGDRSNDERKLAVDLLPWQRKQRRSPSVLSSERLDVGPQVEALPMRTPNRLD